MLARMSVLSTFSALVLLTLGQFASAADILLPKPIVFGSDSRGGGDTKAGTRMTANQIANLFHAPQQDQFLRPKVQMFYNYTSIARIYKNQFNFNSSPGVRADLYSILFLGARESTVQGLIRQIPYDVMSAAEDPQCLEGTTPKAGVAYSNPNRVCIDARIIAAHPGVNSVNAHAVIMGILVHEYSHYKGTNEAEAELLHNYALENIHENAGGTAEKIIQQDLWTLETLTETLAQIQTALQRKQHATACFMIGKLDSTYPSDNRTLSTESLQEYHLFRLTNWQTFNTAFFCRQDDYATKFTTLAFGNAKETSGLHYVKSYYAAAGAGWDDGIYYPQGKLRRITYGDTAELTSQLRSIQQVVRQRSLLLKELKASASK